VTTPTADRVEYVLGTSDQEIARLEFQHAVWRDDAAKAWRKAGFRPGDTVIDVGAGPGFAALDIAAMVAPHGRVIAIDQSRRFLQHLEAQCVARGVTNVTSRLEDLDAFDFTGVNATGAWLRWVLAFVTNPERVLQRVIGSVQPGGVIALHEYDAYESWMLCPHSEQFAAFVSAVMTSWRNRGGEPNIGGRVVSMLERAGMVVEHVRRIRDVVDASDPRWYWPTQFAIAGIERLVELGEVDTCAADNMRACISQVRESGCRMITPSVVEVIARKP
jgi:ubiquinone/menaquinone biosynthesis C-methylase UbiE